MKIFSTLIFFILATVALNGCAGKYKQSIDFNPLEPIRVAVLPFAEVDTKGNYTSDDPNLLIDKVAVVSQDLGEQPRALVRKLVQIELDGSSLDTLSPSLVDSKLTHAGFADEKLHYNYPKLFTTPPSEICTKVFDCDAVLYGKVTRWDRSYYGIQSVTTVGIDLKIISAVSGKILYSTQAEDSDSRGITKIPTGFSSLLIEPIRGLDNDITVQLAKNVVHKMMSSLMTKNRPEYLESSPPSIYASAHNSYEGELPRTGHLMVMLLGSGAGRATFSIGDVIKNIPMAERDEGHYVGEYRPLKEDEFADQQIQVALTDRFGRTTEQRIAAKISLVN